MNFKVNLFFHLYETPFTPFEFPTLIVSRLSYGVGSAPNLFSGLKNVKSRLNPDQNFKKSRPNPDLI